MIPLVEVMQLFLKMYRKADDNFYVNTFRFLDLAGSERFGKKD